jgi:hypothetical protein
MCLSAFSKEMYTSELSMCKHDMSKHMHFSLPLGVSFKSVVRKAWYDKFRLYLDVLDEIESPIKCFFTGTFMFCPVSVSFLVCHYKSACDDSMRLSRESVRKRLGQTKVP